VRLVYRDGVAIVRDDARFRLVQRIATLSATLLKVFFLALNHGSGLGGTKPQAAKSAASSMVPEQV
jgi:hypothetical protein